MNVSASMNLSATQIFGAVAVAVGAILLGFAYNASQVPVDQVVGALARSYSDQTLWYLLLGVAGMVGGAFLLPFGEQRS